MKKLPSDMQMPKQTPERTLTRTTPPPRTSEQTLAPEYRDAAAFGGLYERHRLGFVAVARSYVRDGMVAEDIVTDCFLSFWENRATIDISRSVPAYILTMVKNRCLNWLREQRDHLKAQQNIHSSALRTMSQRIATLEAADPGYLFSEEVASIVEGSVREMPDGMRSVFLASRLNDMTYKQIAAEFGLSVNQVDFEMRKAVKILRAALKDYLAVILFILTVLRG